MVGAAEITPVSSFTMSSYGVNLSPMAVNFATAGVGGMMGELHQWCCCRWFHWIENWIWYQILTDPPLSSFLLFLLIDSWRNFFVSIYHVKDNPSSFFIFVMNCLPMNFLVPCFPPCLYIRLFFLSFYFIFSSPFFVTVVLQPYLSLSPSLL